MSDYPYDPSIQRQVFTAGDRKDWAEVSRIIRGIRNSQQHYDTDMATLRRYPDYVPVWPDEDCDAYERVRCKRCPFWRRDKVHDGQKIAQANTEELGPLSGAVPV